MSQEHQKRPFLSRIALGAIRAVPKFSRKPWVCMISAAVGLVIGLKARHLAENLAPIGEIYMTLLTLTVTPIIFSALATGIAALFSSGEGRRYIGRTVATLVLGTLIAGFLGTFAGTVVLPFFSNLEDKEFVGAMLSKFEDASSAGPKGQEGEAKSGFWAFVGNFVPSNMVGALASDNLLAVVFLGTLLGAAISRIDPEKRQVATDIVGAIFESFLTVLDWVLYLLPVGLCCLMASQASRVGADALRAMLVIIVLYLACFFVMAVLYLWMIRRVTGRTVIEIWRVLREPYTLALVASCDSAIPSTMESMAKFGFPKAMLRSVIPLSAAMNRHATAIIFAITTLFVADVYGMHLTVWQILFVALACSLVGAFDSGEYVTIAPMIAYVLVPLQLPPVAGIAIIMTIWPLIEWFAELQCNMAATANAAIAGNLKAEGDFPA